MHRWYASTNRRTHPIWLLGVLLMIAGGIVCAMPPERDPTDGRTPGLGSVDFGSVGGFLLIVLGAIATVTIVLLSRPRR